MENDYYSDYSDYPGYSSTGYDTNASVGYPGDYSGADPAMMNPAMAGAAATMLGGFLIFMVILSVVFYVFYAVCFMKIAQKTNTPNAWFAWVPILNIILMLQIAGKPLWWILLLFIPFVNIVISILVYMEIAKAVGKPEWLGILMIVPVANLVVPAYLAFSKNETAPIEPSQPQGGPTPQQPGTAT